MTDESMSKRNPRHLDPQIFCVSERSDNLPVPYSGLLAATILPTNPYQIAGQIYASSWFFLSFSPIADISSPADMVLSQRASDNLSVFESVMWARLSRGSRITLKKNTP